MQTATATIQNMPRITKRAETPITKPVSRAEARRLGDEHAISLIEEAVKAESVSLDEVFKVLRG